MPYLFLFSLMDLTNTPYGGLIEALSVDLSIYLISFAVIEVIMNEINFQKISLLQIVCTYFHYSKYFII